jgi:hypothetical protein
VRLSAYNGELSWYEEWIKRDANGNQMGPVYQYFMIHDISGKLSARNPNRYIRVNSYAREDAPLDFVSMPKNWFFGIGQDYYDYTGRP